MFQNDQSDIIQPFELPSYGTDEEGPSLQSQDRDGVVVHPVQMSLTELQLQSIQ